MATFLHELSALESLALGPSGPACDWANTRLALRDPARVKHLPEDAASAYWVITSGAAAAQGELPARIIQRHPRAANDLSVASAMGLLPVAAPEPWIAALRACWREGDEMLRVVAAEVLADLGVFEEELIVSLSKSDSFEQQLSASALLLRWMAHRGEPTDALAAQIAQGILAMEEKDPGCVQDVLTRLGLPSLVMDETSLYSAVAFGETLAGVERTGDNPSRGSLRSSALRFARSALAGSTHPGDQLLLALFERQIPNPASWVAVASWARHRSDPANPVQAVLRGAGEDRHLLSRARLSLTDGDRDAVLQGMAGAGLLSNPVLALLPALRLTERDDLASVAYEVTERLALEDHRARVVFPFAIDVDGLPDDIASGLPFALTRAVFVPTEEVLSALLVLPIPDDIEDLQSLAHALTEQADPAALARLRDLADGWPELEEEVRRATLLLGSPS